MSHGSPTQPRSTATFHFLAGLATGAFSATLLQPVDLLKTRLQQPRTNLLSTLHAITSGPKPLLQLWRGTLPSVLRTGLGSALYFSTLNTLRQSFARSNLLASSAESRDQGVRCSSSSLPRLSNFANLVTGAIARAGAGLILMPLTVLKVRYESNLYSYISLWSAGSAIYCREGVRGFFVGFGATAVRDAPYAGMYVVFYEGLKRRLSTFQGYIVPPSTSMVALKQGMPLSSATINFSSGILAATLATAITNPFDAIKTRLQIMPNEYANMFQAGRVMVREEGARCLFDGLGLRMGRKALSSALAWTLYEELIRRTEKGWEDDTNS